jgi:hypothetical protein
VYKAADCKLGQEVCEVEVEALGYETTPEELFAQLKIVVTAIVGGVQNTLYPIPNPKIKAVLEEYRLLLRIDADVPLPKQFVGYNSVALQRVNLAPSSGTVEVDPEDEMVAETNAVSVLKGYCVTDKADGQRKLLFVAQDGGVYFITSRMGVESCNATVPELKGSLFDGEFIERDIKGAVVNLYAVFDAYVLKGDDIRGRPLLGEGATRLAAMRDGALALGKHTRFPVIVKSFFAEKTVHEAVTKCLAAGLEYETDGLVFTPAAKGVGVTVGGKPPPNKLFTWNLSFKWKPPEESTIDFKVHLKENLGDKWLAVLGVVCKGATFDRPQVALLEQKGPVAAAVEGVRPFVTEDDPYSHLVYLPIVNGSALTLADEVISEGSVVEFSYCPGNANMTKWRPERVRDKEWPNSFETAHNNWETIVKPVSVEMLRGAAVEDDRYYVGNRKAMPLLRAFHGHVKNELIEFAAQEARKHTAAVTLFDMGVGQGGDLWRWRNNNISFVFGVDLFPDNIHNKQIGACMRYLKANTKTNGLRVLFAVADLRQNLFEDRGDLDSLIVRTVFGKAPKEAVDESYHNLAAHHNTQFDVCTAMFMVHYMFESRGALAIFLDNVAACTSLGGHFIGAAWDGADVFKRLADVPKDATVEFGGVTVKKLYANKDFEAGLPIEVSTPTFTSSVEYLVDFSLLEKLLQKKGFQTVFVRPFEHYYKGFQGVNQAPLSSAEREISFWNRAFAFKKIE